ncbi:MAG: Helix-turn-helix domain [Pseudomonadota bacterium]|jgi:hypothetical protein
MSRNAEATKAAPFGPVLKIQWLCGAAGRSELSRAELAVLIVLADHINTETGKAWPSFGRIARIAATTVRTAKRAVSRLVAMDLIQIAEHGGPGRSNRYRLNRGLFGQDGDGDIDDTMQVAMVTPVATYGDTHSSNMVSLMSPDPINPSEQEAKDEIERSQAEGMAAPLRPIGACGLPRASEYAVFWEAWGRRVTVSETERLIDAKVEAGFSLNEIISGVKRFQQYCIATGKPARIKPAAFIHGEKWLDDWQLCIVHTASTKNKRAKVTRPAKKSNIIPKKVANPWVRNPDRSEWQSRYQREALRYFERFNVKSTGEATIEQHKAAVKHMDAWKVENPEPHLFMHKETGATWGSPEAKLPAADWMPQKGRGQ